MNKKDEKYMSIALELAARGRGKVSPNPMVGAVVVKEGRIIGRGYHEKAGTPHAEVHALNEAGDKAKGATLYVTLEPCCHYGKTPPCSRRVIASGVSRVVVAVEDPNPKVCGGGIKELRQAGIEVTMGVLEEEARRLNEAFFKYITTGLPFVILKAAASMDGKIATRRGDSRWITGEKAREYGHYLRSIVDAVLVGVGTLIADDPQLNTRLIPQEKNMGDPRRIILDSRARVPLEAKVIKENADKTIIAVTSGAPESKVEQLRQQGVTVWRLSAEEGRVSLPDLLKRLGEEKITSVLVEGGGEVNASFLSQKLVDKINLFIAPKIIGGKEAPSWVGGKGVERLAECSPWKMHDMKQLGEDLLLEFYPLGVASQDDIHKQE